MVNRQDAPHSPASPEIGRHSLATKTISDETKLPLVAEPPKPQHMVLNCSALLCSPLRVWFPFPLGKGLVDHALHAPGSMKTEQHISCARHRATVPESKVARRAQLCVFHFHTACRGHPCRPPRRRLFLSWKPVVRLARARDTFNSNQGVRHGGKSNQGSSRGGDRVYRAQSAGEAECD